ncbi:MAG: hypothetical protein WA374_20990 [Acidobacteriaceae bacterium]
MTRRTVQGMAWCCAAAVVALVLGGGSLRAQDSDFHLDLHANGHATAHEIGLPEYPGAKPYKNDKDGDKDDSGSADLGLVLNSFHFQLQVASYITPDSAEKVLHFYRKPLAHYGEVLECDHGRPVGSLVQTRSGLTCGDKSHVQFNESEDSSTDRELRAGTPKRFRIVAIDNSVAGQTKFGLVSLELPKDSQ